MVTQNEIDDVVRRLSALRDEIAAWRPAEPEPLPEERHVSRPQLPDETAETIEGGRWPDTIYPVDRDNIVLDSCTFRAIRIAPGVSRVLIKNCSADYIECVPLQHAGDPLASDITISHCELISDHWWGIYLQADNVEISRTVINTPQNGIYSRIRGEDGRQMRNVIIRDCAITSRVQTPYSSESPVRLNQIDGLDFSNNVVTMWWRSKQTFRLHTNVSNALIRDNTFKGAGVAFGTEPTHEQGPIRGVRYHGNTVTECHNVGVWQPESVTGLVATDNRFEIAADNPDQGDPIARYSGEDWELSNNQVVWLASGEEVLHR